MDRLKSHDAFLAKILNPRMSRWPCVPVVMKSQTHDFGCCGFMSDCYQPVPHNSWSSGLEDRIGSLDNETVCWPASQCWNCGYSVSLAIEAGFVRVCETYSTTLYTTFESQHFSSLISSMGSEMCIRSTMEYHSLWPPNRSVLRLKTRW